MTDAPTDATLHHDDVAVPVDGSRLSLTALATAVRFARVLGASLTVVTVRTAGDTHHDVAERLEQAAAFAVSEAGWPVEPRTLALHGDDPADALSEYDASTPGTLLCMTTRGRGALRRALLGTTALAVVERTPGAVVLVGPRCAARPEAPIDPVVACLDGSIAAEVILPFAAHIARSAGSSLVLVRAIYPMGDPGVADPPTADRRASLSYLGELARSDRFRGVDVTTHTVPGERPVDVIADAIRGRSDAVLAVATSHPGALAAFVEGSVTADAVRTSEVPVLVASR